MDILDLLQISHVAVVEHDPADFGVDTDLATAGRVRVELFDEIGPVLLRESHGDLLNR